MEISVKQLFDLFVHHLGHKVIKRRQEAWASSPEGWEHHALLHMIYWVQQDFRELTHGKDREVATSSRADLLELSLIESLWKNKMIMKDLSDQP